MLLSVTWDRINILFKIGSIKKMKTLIEKESLLYHPGGKVDHHLCNAGVNHENACHARGKERSFGSSQALNLRPAHHLLTKELSSSDREVFDTYYHQMTFLSLPGIGDNGAGKYFFIMRFSATYLMLYPSDPQLSRVASGITVCSVTDLHLLEKVTAPKCPPTSPDSPTVCQ